MSMKNPQLSQFHSSPRCREHSQPVLKTSPRVNGVCSNQSWSTVQNPTSFGTGVCFLAIYKELPEKSFGETENPSWGLRPLQKSYKIKRLFSQGFQVGEILLSTKAWLGTYNILECSSIFVVVMSTRPQPSALFHVDTKCFPSSTGVLEIVLMSLHEGYVGNNAKPTEEMTDTSSSNALKTLGNWRTPDGCRFVGPQLSNNRWRCSKMLWENILGARSNSSFLLSFLFFF